MSLSQQKWTEKSPFSIMTTDLWLTITLPFLLMSIRDVLYVTKNASGSLKRHMKINGNQMPRNVPNVVTGHVCLVCGKQCKSLARLKGLVQVWHWQNVAGCCVMAMLNKKKVPIMCVCVSKYYLHFINKLNFFNKAK